jgi:hypothetical protein
MDKLEHKGYLVAKLFSNTLALKLLEDIKCKYSSKGHSITKNMTSLQSVQGKSFRYKFDIPLMPESWDEEFLPMIKRALPSLFGDELEFPSRITKVSLLLSSEGGEIQPCHVDAGW